MLYHSITSVTRLVLAMNRKLHSKEHPEVVTAIERGARSEATNRERAFFFIHAASTMFALMITFIGIGSILLMFSRYPNGINLFAVLLILVGSICAGMVSKFRNKWQACKDQETMIIKEPVVYVTRDMWEAVVIGLCLGLLITGGIYFPRNQYT